MTENYILQIEIFVICIPGLYARAESALTATEDSSQGKIPCEPLESSSAENQKTFFLNVVPPIAFNDITKNVQENAAEDSDEMKWKVTHDLNGLSHNKL